MITMAKKDTLASRDRLRELTLDNGNFSRKDALQFNKEFPNLSIEKIEDFLKKDEIDRVVAEVNKLENENADCKFINPSPREHNKFAFEKNLPHNLILLFQELNSPEFIRKLEKLTGIPNIVTGNISLRGAGVHRIDPGGYLSMHTDFNSYMLGDIKLDRRINLLLYLNENWKEENGGNLILAPHPNSENKHASIILPNINRCVIFNTTKQSIHGHPQPTTRRRQSIAVYYYTKNTRGLVDFEGDEQHSTRWYSFK